MRPKLRFLGTGVIVHECAERPEQVEIDVVFKQGIGWHTSDGAAIRICPWCGERLPEILPDRPGTST